MQYPMRFQTGRPRARARVYKLKKQKKKGKRKEGQERVSNA